VRRGLRILGALVVLLVVALAVNDVLLRYQVKPAKASGGRIVAVSGGALQVRQDGPRRAPAIVLLHGFDASIRWWQPSVPALARRHRVIRIDLLGHGGSAKPRDGYSMQNQARLVSAVLRKLRVRRAIVAGHSMGAAVAVALAEAHPRVVRGVVVVDEAARPGQDTFPLTAKLGFYPLIGPGFRRVATDSVIYDAFKIGFAPGFKYPRWVVQDNRRMTYSSYNKSENAEAAFVKARGLDRRLAATRKPVLVLFGTREQILKPGAWRAYRSVRRARIRLIGGAGHSPMFEKPRPTTRHMLTFARRVEGAGA
jgi:pimeloyl-ACP methyl ester carboxylesterase